MMMTRATALVKLLFSLSATTLPNVSGGSNISGGEMDNIVSSKNTDPLLLRVARGEATTTTDGSNRATPVWMMRQAGRHMQAYQNLVEQYPTFRQRSELPEVSKEISLQPFRSYGVDGVILFSDILTPLPAMGIDFSISEGGKITIQQPIRTRADFLARLKRINVKTACPFVGQVLGELREEVGSASTVLGFVGMPFTVGSYVVEGQTGLSTKFAHIKALMEQDPTLLHDILSLLAKNLADYACYQIDSGAQIIQCFDSWAGHVPNDAYAEFAQPYQKEVIDEIKRRHPETPIIIYMAPGEYSEGGRRLLQLAATGADFVSIDHTIDFERARQILPKHVGIQGNLDPQILRNGPKEEIRVQTERILNAAKGTKHIMNLGHGIDKDTPEEFAAFFVKTVQNYKGGVQ